MKRISPEKEITYISLVIEKNIEAYKILKDIGLLSQNILAQLRNLVEDVAILINNRDNNLHNDSHYINVEPSINYVKRISKYKFINDFHEFLQSTSSHYTPNDDGAERLIFYYFGYICQLKNLLKEEFNMDIIHNIEDFPIYEDSDLKEQYELIWDKLEEVPITKERKFTSGRFYVQKVKPIYAKGNLFYEITLTKATDYINKFERITMYSKIYIPDNYSINISYVEKEIVIFSNSIKIKIIANYFVSIRSCELNNLGKIFGLNLHINTDINEYKNLMEYLTINKTTICHIVQSSETEYKSFKDFLKKNTKNNKISELLKYIRNLIVNKNRGANILKYLTFKLENVVIKSQLSYHTNPIFSGLYLKNGSFPFDSMPYAMSLSNHNISWFHLLQSIDMYDREYELLGRFVRNNTEKNNILYTPLDKLEQFNDVDGLIDKYNNKLVTENIDTNGNNILIKEHNYIYLKSYEENSKNIINIINDYINKKSNEIKNLLDTWSLSFMPTNISDDKQKILKTMLRNDSIAIIHGSAGTGKTKMLELIADIFKDYKKLFLANTNTAKNNLERRISTDNSKFMTVSKYLQSDRSACDILLVDECSTINNLDMLKILKLQNYKVIILSGDTYQIESIKYGNWFYLCNKLYNNHIVYNLEDTHRTDDEDLLELWNFIRNDDQRAIAKLNNQEYSCKLDETIFQKNSTDEIILCLNYDGVYGINNINKIMQTSNSGKEYNIGVDTYRIGDPILFNDCPRFSKLLYNNLKGTIKNICEEIDCVWFTIQIDDIRNLWTTQSNEIEIEESDKQGKINVRFKVNKFRDRDDDENVYEHIIPFNLSYAVSIHKAQGLEYDSVKVIITSSIEENITKNIFYTAITRTKKHLKIYWSSETQTRIFKNFEERKNSRDISILKSKIS